MRHWGVEQQFISSKDHFGFLFAFFSLMGVGLLCCSVAQGGQQVGELTRSQGDCVAESKDLTRQVHLDDPIFFQDILSTGTGAGLVGKLADSSEVTLGENARLKIDKFVYDPDSKGGRLNLRLFQGPMVFIGGKLDTRRKARVHIETPVVTLGVRGTRLWTGQIDGAFGVLVLDGRVAVFNPWGSVELGPGEGTMIPGPDKPPGAVKTWPKEKVDRALNSIKFEI